MEDKKTKICIYCKRELAATIDNFTEERKGKYGLGNVCINCQNERKWCGVSNRQVKSAKKSRRYMSRKIKP